LFADEIRAERNEVQEKIEEVRANIMTLQSKVKSLEEELATHQKEYDIVQAVVSEQRAKLQAADKNISSLNRGILQLLSQSDK